MTAFKKATRLGVTGHARFMSSPRHLPLLAVTLVLAGLWLAAWPFTIDDAYIVARYAQRLASGRGYTYNDGVVSDGVTGPLWLLSLTLGAWLGGDPLAVGKLLGLAASACSALLVLRQVRERALGARAVWVVGALLASSLPFVVWTVAGLESGLAALIATALALLVVKHRRGGAIGVALGLLGWLRPELLPFGASLWGALWWRDRAVALRAGLIALAAGIALVVFRLTLFGHVLPMSASAKPALLANGAAYVQRALVSPHGVSCALCLALALRSAGRETRTLAIALVVHALALVLAGGDWMPGRRLFAPLAPVLAMALGTALARLALQRPRVSCALGALLLATSLHELAPELLRVRSAARLQRERLPGLAAAVCASRGPVAALDVGALGVACPHHTFIDLGGLIEPAVAYAAGGHLDKRISATWLASQQPELIVLHSRERPKVDASQRVRWFAGYPIERRVLGFAFVQRSYRVQQVIEYADDYFYLLLARRR